MANYTGKVNGIDTQVSVDLPLRCQAFINLDAENYIQVTTGHHSLQTALELACYTGHKVEVTYDGGTGENILTRVRVLDR